jgi:hypothetical protein
MNLYETLMRMTPAQRERFLSRAHSFISEPGFLTLLDQIDVNQKETIGPVCAQLRMYEPLPDFRAKLAAWLRVDSKLRA